MLTNAYGAVNIDNSVFYGIQVLNTQNCRSDLKSAINTFNGRSRIIYRLKCCFRDQAIAPVSEVDALEVRNEASWSDLVVLENIIEKDHNSSISVNNTCDLAILGLERVRVESRSCILIVRIEPCESWVDVSFCSIKVKYRL